MPGAPHNRRERTEQRVSTSRARKEGPAAGEEYSPLSNHNDRHKIFFQNVRDAMFVADLKTRRLVDANRAAVRLMGYPRKQLLAMKADQLHPREVRRMTMEAFGRHAAGSREEVDSLVVTGKGERIPVGIRTCVVQIDGRSYLIGVFRDISRRKEKEEKFRQSENRSQILSKAALTLLRVTDPLKRYDYLLEHARKITKSRFGFIGYIDPETGYLVAPTMTKDVWNECRMRDKDFVLKKFGGLWGWVLTHKEVVLANDPMSDPRRSGQPEGHIQVKNFLGVPCIWRGRIVGMVALANKEGGYTREDRKLLSDYTRLVTVAILDHRRFREKKLADEALSRNRQLESRLLEIVRDLPFCRDFAEVWDTVAGPIAKTIGAGAVSLYLPDREGSHFRLVGSYGLAEDDMERVNGKPDIPIRRDNLPGRVYLTGRPVFCSDMATDPGSEKWMGRARGEEVRSLVVMPIVPKKSSIGVAVFYYADRKEFTREEIRRIRLVINQLTPALARIEADRKIMESEQRFRSLVENSLVGVYLIQDGLFRYVNPNLAEIFGYSQQELIGKKGPEDLTLPEDWPLVRENLRRRTEGEAQSLHYTFRGMKKNGAPFFVEVFGSRVPYQGRPAVVGTLLDITERRRMEEELSRAQRLEAAGRVAGQIAHDFNNLLSPLMAYPDLIRMECEKDDPILPVLEQMQSAAVQMSEINQQLLTLGRRGHYNLETLSVNELIRRVLGSIALPATVVVEDQFDSDLMPIKGGPAQLSRVFTNLIHNACEAMGNIGRLGLLTGNVYLDRTLKGYETIQRGEYVKVEITDTGCGIEPRHMDRIFDPFFTTKTTDKKRGSGLGLSVVRTVMEDHHGYIGVESRVGEGTRFSLYFPITRDVESTEKSPDRPERRGTERILVVDDDPVQREVLTRILTRLGYRVHAVASGEEAVFFVREHPQDLLILDMIMGGIDGTETYKRILEIHPQQKAVILSGYAESGRVAEARRMGASGFIRKPVNVQVLSCAIRDVLDG